MFRKFPAAEYQCSVHNIYLLRVFIPEVNYNLKCRTFTEIIDVRLER